jgi:hypothetical protein
MLSAGSSRVQRWIIELDPQQRDRLARATGVADEQLDAMTLSRYHRVGRRMRGGAQISRGPWERATGSRFCPDCLRETGGRWQLTWRLAWSFACVTHQRLLADDCPDCGRAQRCVPHPAGVVPQPGRCARPGSPVRARRRDGVHRISAVPTHSACRPIIPRSPLSKQCSPRSNEDSARSGSTASIHNLPVRSSTTSGPSHTACSNNAPGTIFSR